MEDYVGDTDCRLVGVIAAELPPLTPRESRPSLRWGRRNGGGQALLRYLALSIFHCFESVNPEDLLCLYN